jgi:Zn-dependent protease
MQDPDIIQMIFSIAVLIFSVVAHEVSHGYMAQYLGDPTARLAGRLTMNPVKHLDPIGSIVAPLFSMFFLGGMIIGWAKPVPYNPYNLRDQKWGDAKVALAGPLTNIGIAVIFALFLRFGGTFFTDPMEMMMHLIIKINIILAIFNLVPIPPLDGSKVLMSILPYRFRYIGDYLERYALFFILFFAFFLWQYFMPLIDLIYMLLVGWSFM